MFTREFHRAVGAGWRRSFDGFVAEVARKVGGQLGGRVIAALAFLFECFQGDPVQIVGQMRNYLAGPLRVFGADLADELVIRQVGFKRRMADE